MPTRNSLLSVVVWSSAAVWSSWAGALSAGAPQAVRASRVTAASRDAVNLLMFIVMFLSELVLISKQGACFLTISTTGAVKKP